ncbi:unnamed protein product [Rotaria magnacalcarata]|uniref:ADP ribosyltransferase domain-containing protein n=1 Tax=Rotaria magnacalcarata TaxID=392030 RepID=A0A819MHD7_9BILA|nr:unnamed protein product [Rotaria magnacalcarata]CAF3979252.1 unnamed protein product [Rotaria magnacalcarata]
MLKAEEKQENDGIIRRNLMPIEMTRNEEDFLLIWLDATIDDSHKSLQIQQDLLELHPNAQFYTDLQLCVNLIKSIKNEHILLIVSESFAPYILKEAGSLQTITTAFIFSNNPTNQELVVNDYGIVTQVFNDQQVLLHAIRDTLRHVVKEPLAFSLCEPDGKSTRNLSKEAASFLWHKFLIIVLRQMPHDEQAKNDMLSKCLDYNRRNNTQLNNINRFQQTYHATDAIKWYTTETFLYGLVNKAFRTDDIELIYLFRFFIIDLCDQLEREHEAWRDAGEQTLYRGQNISNEEFKKLKNGVGKLIATNGFFSTSRSINVALAFAPRNIVSKTMTGVLFEIQADTSLKTIIMADIKSSSFPDEKEVLFSLGATFEIRNVEFDTIHNLWRIKLIATEQGDERLQQYIQLQEQEMKAHTPLIYFGALLWEELGQVDQALNYFKILLRTLPPDHPDISGVYCNIGSAYLKKKELSLALKHHEIAYQMRQNQHHPCHHRIASSLINIGMVYIEKCQYDLGLQYCSEALALYEKSFPHDYVCNATAMRCIGNVYMYKNDYDKALNHFKQSLSMCERLVPDQADPRKAICMGYIGEIYEKLGDLDQAMEYYRRKLMVEEKCLLSDCPELSENIEWIVRIYMKMSKVEFALKFCREKLKSQKETFGEIHALTIRTRLIIGKLHAESGSFACALKTYRKALLFAKFLYPSNKKIIIECLAKISDVFFSCKDYDNSLTNRECQLELQRQIYSPEHPSIGICLISIGNILSNMGKHAEALDYFNNALKIFEPIYPSDNNDVRETRDRIRQEEWLLIHSQSDQ